MKKIVMLTLLTICFFFTSCGNDSNSMYSKTYVENTSSTSIVKVTETTSEISDNILKFNDNILELDLSLSENSEYLSTKKDYNLNKDNILHDGRRIVEDRNLYIEEPSGERKVLIELPDEETNMEVGFYGMIDENRICYGLLKEFVRNVGIYNLNTGKDFRLESGYVFEKLIGENLFLSKCHVVDFNGFAKLNLDTYEITEIDCSSLLDNNIYYWGGPDISTDGTKAAIYGIVSKSGDVNEYQVAIYSLEDEKILQTFNFFSENNYVNHKLLFYNDNQVYLFVNQYGDNPKEMLYIIDLN